MQCNLIRIFKRIPVAFLLSLFCLFDCPFWANDENDSIGRECTGASTTRYSVVHCSSLLSRVKIHLQLIQYWKIVSAGPAAFWMITIQSNIFGGRNALAVRSILLWSVLIFKSDRVCHSVESHWGNNIQSACLTKFGTALARKTILLFD